LVRGVDQDELQGIRQTLRFDWQSGCRNLVQNEIVLFQEGRLIDAIVTTWQIDTMVNQRRENVVHSYGNQRH
jgi:hypothetical protein